MFCSPRRLTQDEFIERARSVHGNKYDYSKVEYKGKEQKVLIICPEHGEFWQLAGNHLTGRGCPDGQDWVKEYSWKEQA